MVSERFEWDSYEEIGVMGASTMSAEVCIFVVREVYGRGGFWD